MEREITKDTINAALSELIKHSQHHGYATARQDDARDAATREHAESVARRYAEDTYKKRDEIVQLIEQLRTEAYTAGVADGERGETGRLEAVR